jgi:hypothetical protein
MPGLVLLLLPGNRRVVLVLTFLMSEIAEVKPHSTIVLVVLAEQTWSTATTVPV